MSAAFPGHERADSSAIRNPTISHMEHATQSKSDRRPLTGDKGTAVATAQENATDDESSGTSGASLGSRQDTRAEIKEVNKRSLDYVLRSGCAGGLAGCAAKTVVAPLDRVKILFQASNPQYAKYTGSWFGLSAAMKDIYHFEGSRGLFKGHSATLLRIFPYAAIKFLAYEQIRAVVITSQEQETPFRRLISGSMAGITSVFFTYPLELIRVRLAFETKNSSRSSLGDTFKQIYNERISPPSMPGKSNATVSSAPVAATAQTMSSTVNKVVPSSGLANFYRGFSPTMLGMLPYAGMSFLTHDTVGDWLRLPGVARYTTIPGSEGNTKKGTRRPQLTAAAELFSGAIAGLVSQTSSYPLEVIRRRMQVGGAVGDGRRLSIAETVRKISMESGSRGFFVGLTIGYIKVVPMVATSFFAYERFKWWLGI